MIATFNLAALSSLLVMIAWYDNIIMIMYVIPHTIVQIVNSFWQITPNYVIWSSNSRTLNLILMVVHTACWMSIATSVFTIDYLELLGVKQVANTD